MTQINKECLARAMAVIDGKGKLFDECKNDIELDIKHGYYVDYVIKIGQLIKQYEKELENHES